MDRRKPIYLLTLLLLFLSFEVLATEHIRVDASKDWGGIPDILSSSLWITHPSEKDIYILHKFFSENRPSTIQLTIPLGGTDFKSFKRDMREYLSNEGVSLVIEKSKEYNTTLIIGFDPAPMRSWLSSRPGDYRKIGKNTGSFNIEQTSPPANYHLWGEVVKETLTYFRNGLHVRNLGFYVGHEPNRDWLGSEESFFKYYEEAARAAKSVSKNIKVGGIGPWSVEAPKVPCDYPEYAPYVSDLCSADGGWADPQKQPLLRNFITYVAHYRLPLDFINWHSFGAIPEGFLKDADTIRGWLKESGIEEETIILFPSDWTYWANSYPADYLDGQENAAYCIQAIYYMWKAGIGWHGHDFNVFDDGLENAIKGNRQNKLFIGNWGIFTRRQQTGWGITKPVYNALKALTIVAGKNTDHSRRLISTQFPEKESIVAFSTLSDNRKRISLMISHYTPHDTEKLKKHILHKIETTTEFLEKEKIELKKCMEKNSGKRKDKALLECINKLIPTINDFGKTEAINFIKNIYPFLGDKKRLEYILNTSQIEYSETRKIANTLKDVIDDVRPRQIQVHFTNIPFTGKAKLITYTIDDTYSNACTFNKSTEPTKTNAPCGMGGVIDQAVWTAKEEASKEGMKAAKDYLLSSGYTNKEIGFVEKNIKKYKNTSGIKQNLNQWIKKIHTKWNKYPPKKIQADFKNAFERYRGSYRSSYYNALDTINNWNEISLEGSKREKEIVIKERTFVKDITVEPNSVYLFILKEDTLD
ncbi:MAG: hypothetical protein E3K32_07535 [wastewater metagenome]|nr:hypothetical protein [Candidatus Loosdrechtia aerotolerans]